MAVLKVLEYGDPVLRKEAEKVHKVSAKIQKLISDMFDTMYDQQGVGLAAPQVGVLKRLFVLDCTTPEQNLPQMVMINPAIVKKSGAIRSKEGCLSFPGVWTEVKRYENIVVRYMDQKGKRQELAVDGGGLLSRAIQHELDHLNGVLFVDHALDETEANEQLGEHNLPPIDPTRIVEEPDLDHVLMGN